MAHFAVVDERLQRKTYVKNNVVWLINHSFKVNEDASAKLVYDRIGVSFPDAPAETPAYILTNAAKNLWIKLQGQLRKMTEDEQNRAEGQEFTADSIVKERVKVDPVTKTAREYKNLKTAAEKIEALVKMGMPESEAEAFVNRTTN